MADTYAIAVAGPAYLDHTIRVHGTLSLDGSRRIAEEYKDVGGTGLCYALALARQGNAITLFSAVGRDSAAGSITQYIGNEKNLEAVWQHTTPVSDYAVLFVDDNNHKCVAAQKNASDAWRPDEDFLTQAAHSDALVITSFKNSIVSRVLTQLTSRDTTIKPFIMWAPHFSNCAEAKTIVPMLPAIDHITLNEEEYVRLHKEIGDPTRAGVGSVTVTQGKQGVKLIEDGTIKKFSQIVRIDRPLDTNGAGEAFGAGFLTTFLRNRDYHQAILAGSFIGALHTERRGSDFPHVRIPRAITLQGALS